VRFAVPQCSAASKQFERIVEARLGLLGSCSASEFRLRAIIGESSWAYDRTYSVPIEDDGGAAGAALNAKAFGCMSSMTIVDRSTLMASHAAAPLKLLISRTLILGH
jgi:hypothetical protein